MSATVRRVVLLAVLATLAVTQASTQGTSAITTPKQQFGFAIGDDYALATYTQLEAYWSVLDQESERLALVDIGRTEEGRTQWMAVVSAPENIEQLDRYRAIARRLALAEGLSDAEARALASEGKAVVWIDGGLHADETLGAQQLIETVYQLVSRNDEETRRFLQDVIVLAVDANPDGHELVSSWYMRERTPSARTLAGVPRLYQRYAGHDNNRDFFMSALAETRNINRVLYQDWFPQVVYDHHQTAPAGTVMFAPPFGPPSNYLFDPLVPITIDLFGAAMHARFAAEGKPGVTTRSGSDYSTWWNGGLRTTAYFHNQIGLLTETLGGPTPTRIPFVAEARLSSTDLPLPIAPGEWRFRQAVEYSVTANRAVLDAASRNRETLLFGAYRMARNSIERGRRDNWTPTPHRLDIAGVPDARDPRGYILPGDQPDMPTVTAFIGALMRTGIGVERATASFAVGAKRYPSGSFIVRTAQAFRPHVLDMFEPQDHPDGPSPEATSAAPYDNAGWTLAYQMGVQFDRVLDAFDGPFERLDVPPSSQASQLAGDDTAAGYLLKASQNASYAVVNRLLATDAQVYWVHRSDPGQDAFYVPRTQPATGIVREAARLGVAAGVLVSKPSGDTVKLSKLRIGLWDQYGGSVESGWARYVLERFDYAFERVYPQVLDAGALAARFDVLIFPDGALPGRDAASSYSDSAPPLALLPEPYRTQTGVVTSARTIPQLRAFVNAGGTLLAIGTSAVAAAEHFDLPVTNVLADARTGRDLPRDRFDVPGSVLQVSVDASSRLASGSPSAVDIMFDRNPSFRVDANATPRVRAAASFTRAMPLRSGWARGQELLRGSSTVVEASVGRGRVVLYGPSPVYRAQSHGAFRFLFNGIHLARAERVSAVP